MKRKLRPQFWIEVALATLSVLFAALTLLWKDWIEIVFRVDPDHHSGALEWVIALTCLAATIACSALARREWRRSPVVPDAT